MALQEMKYDFREYVRGREAFETFLCDNSDDVNVDFFAGVIHSMMEWFEELNISDSVVRTLTDSGQGLTGKIM